MSTHGERIERTSSCDIQIEELFRGAEALFVDCAAAIRGPLSQEGLEPLVDDQVLTSAYVVIKNKSPNGKPYSFKQTDEEATVVTPEKLKVSFALSEIVKNKKEHVLRKWLAGMAPFIDDSALLRASPKEYASLQVSIWSGDMPNPPSALHVHYIRKDAIVALTGSHITNPSRLCAIQRDITTARHLMEICKEQS